MCSLLYNKKGSVMIMSSRFSEFIQRTPLCTIALVAINVAVHVLIFLFDFRIGLLSINKNDVLYHFEVNREYLSVLTLIDTQIYRLISPAYVHIG